MATTRLVDAKIAQLLQTFKGIKVKNVTVILPSQKQHTLPSSGKPVNVDDLAARFYREGADLVVTPEGKLTWVMDGITYRPNY